MHWLACQGQKEQKSASHTYKNKQQKEEIAAAVIYYLSVRAVRSLLTRIRKFPVCDWQISLDFLSSEQFARGATLAGDVRQIHARTRRGDVICILSDVSRKLAATRGNTEWHKSNVKERSAREFQEHAENAVRQIIFSRVTLCHRCAKRNAERIFVLF